MSMLEELKKFADDLFVDVPVVIRQGVKDLLQESARELAAEKAEVERLRTAIREAIRLYWDGGNKAEEDAADAMNLLSTALGENLESAELTQLFNG